MKISNPLEINDWPFKKFLVVVLAIQLALLGIYGLKTLGWALPLAEQVTGFLYLSLVPGMLLLRIFKLHNLGSITTLLYSLGLSLTFIMFTGSVMNAIYPFFGILNPISTVSLIISFAALIIVFCSLAYIRDKDFSMPSKLNIEGMFSASAFLLCLLPLLAVLATQMVNLYQNNIVLILLIFLIGLTAFLIAIGKIIPRSLYPFAVFSIGLSLLFYRSLISQYISGSDIHEEYYFANLVNVTGVWDTKSPLILVNMLSITMLAPIFSLISSIDITWVFKVVYPILFLAPLGIYQISARQTNDRVAFLSSFFFMSVSYFFTAIPVVARQQIATIFVILLTLLITEKRIDETNRSILFCVFGAALVVSHYGLSFIYIFYIIFAWLILQIIDTSKKPQGHFTKSIQFERYFGSSRLITSTRLLFFVVIALFWYMSTSSGTVFERYVHIGQNIIADFSSSFLNPESSQGLTALLTHPKPGILHTLNAVVNYGNQIFIIIGLAFVILKRKEWAFNQEYVVFAALSLIVIFSGVFIPFLTLRVDMQRLYHIALIFLAPICVIGGLEIFSWIGRSLKNISFLINIRINSKANAVSLLGIYFVIFFLFETGVIWQLTERYLGSVSLSQENIKLLGNSQQKSYFYSSVTPEQDVQSAKWLVTNMFPGNGIYATYNDAQVHPLTSYGMTLFSSVSALSPTIDVLPDNSYVYLQYLNVVENIGTTFNSSSLSGMTIRVFKISDISHLFAIKDKIYSNGGSEIYK